MYEYNFERHSLIVHAAVLLSQLLYVLCELPYWVLYQLQYQLNVRVRQKKKKLRSSVSCRFTSISVVLTSPRGLPWLEQAGQ